MLYFSKLFDLFILMIQLISASDLFLNVLFLYICVSIFGLCFNWLWKA